MKKKKKAKYVAKKGRQLTAKQTKKIRGGIAAVAYPASRGRSARALDIGDDVWAMKEIDTGRR